MTTIRDGVVSGITDRPVRNFDVTCLPVESNPEPGAIGECHPIVNRCLVGQDQAERESGADSDVAADDPSDQFGPAVICMLGAHTIHKKQQAELVNTAFSI